MLLLLWWRNMYIWWLTDDKRSCHRRRTNRTPVVRYQKECWQRFLHICHKLEQAGGQTVKTVIYTHKHIHIILYMLWFCVDGGAFLLATLPLIVHCYSFHRRVVVVVAVRPYQLHRQFLSLDWLLTAFWVFNCGLPQLVKVLQNFGFIASLSAQVVRMQHNTFANAKNNRTRGEVDTMAVMPSIINILNKLFLWPKFALILDNCAKNCVTQKSWSIWYCHVRNSRMY